MRPLLVRLDFNLYSVLSTVIYSSLTIIISGFKITFAPVYYFASYSKQLEDTTAQLKRTSAALEEAKQRTDALLYQMLPVKVANQLRDGNKVEAGEESIIKSKKGIAGLWNRVFGYFYNGSC